MSRDVTFHEAIFPLAISGSAAPDCSDHVEQPMDRMHSQESTSWPSSNVYCPVTSGPVPSGLDRSGLPPADPQPLSTTTEPQSVLPASLVRPGLDARGSVSGPEDAQEASSRRAQQAVDMVPQTAEPMQHPEPESGPHNRGQRVCKAPSHLQDYFCYSVHASNLSSNASPVQKASSGKPYPIANYVTCNNFASAHRNYLAAITKIVEPRTFQEAVKDPNWRRK